MSPPNRTPDPEPADLTLTAKDTLEREVATLRAEVERLTARLEGAGRQPTWEGTIVHLNGCSFSPCDCGVPIPLPPLPAQLAAALERERALREALDKYGAHDHGCPSYPGGTWVMGSPFRMRPCDCGLAALIAPTADRSAP